MFYQIPGLIKNNRWTRYVSRPTTGKGVNG